MYVLVMIAVLYLHQLMPYHLFAVMSELLFEGYGVPSVSYGVDSLFSFYANNKNKKEDGIVISAGNTATHIIPVLGGRGAMDRAKRFVPVQ